MHTLHRPLNTILLFWFGILSVLLVMFLNWNLDLEVLEAVWCTHSPAPTSPWRIMLGRLANSARKAVKLVEKYKPYAVMAGTSCSISLSTYPVMSMKHPRRSSSAVRIDIAPTRLLPSNSGIRAARVITETRGEDQCVHVLQSVAMWYRARPRVTSGDRTRSSTECMKIMQNGKKTTRSRRRVLFADTNMASSVSGHSLHHVHRCQTASAVAECDDRIYSYVIQLITINESCASLACCVCQCTCVHVL